MNQKKSLMKCHVSKSIDCKNILKNIQSFPLLWLYSAEAKKSKREDPRNNEVALDLLIAIRSCNLLLWRELLKILVGVCCLELSKS